MSTGSVSKEWGGVTMVVTPEHEKGNPMSTCSGCTLAFPAKPGENTAGVSETKGYVAKDDPTGTLFFTGRHPYHAPTYPVIRQACVRSKLKALSSELQSKAEKVFIRERAAVERTEALLTRVNSFVPTSPGKLKPWPNYEPERRPVVALRSLNDLLGEKDLSKQLHDTLSWTLKAFMARAVENLAEGRALAGTYAHDLDDREDPTPNPFATDLGSPQYPQNGCRIRSYTQLSDKLGADKFMNVLHHVLVGNQVVVRGGDKQLVGSILWLLKDFIPSFCCSMQDYSDTYEEPWKYNLLGLPSAVQVPDDIDADLYAVIDIKPRTTTDKLPTSPDEYDYITIATTESPASSTSPSSPTPSQIPTLIGEVHRVLRVHSDVSTLRTHIMFLKEAWLNKAKMFFKFVRSGGGDDAKKLEMFLEHVEAGERDLPVLRFWTKGIGNEGRRKLLVG
ncbi:hypothetical protein HDV00_001136 [Rhizophlyctis rosea]|nr:hypothetical protein HDV00_001136 [Rhizophlyctis rosea]